MKYLFEVWFFTEEKWAVGENKLRVLGDEKQDRKVNLTWNLDGISLRVRAGRFSFIPAMAGSLRRLRKKKTNTTVGCSTSRTSSCHHKVLTSKLQNVFNTSFVTPRLCLPKQTFEVALRSTNFCFFFVVDRQLLKQFLFNF